MVCYICLNEDQNAPWANSGICTACCDQRMLSVDEPMSRWIARRARETTESKMASCQDLLDKITRLVSDSAPLGWATHGNTTAAREYEKAVRPLLDEAAHCLAAIKRGRP